MLTKSTKYERRQRERQVREWARQGRCMSCGGKEFVKAVDNHGEEYEGCARCVIVIPPELQQVKP